MIVAAELQAFKDGADLEGLEGVRREVEKP